MINKWINNNRFHLAVTSCILCGASAGQATDLCPACEKDLPRMASSCYRCGAETAAPSDVLCGRCLQRAPPMERTISALRYGPPLTRLITDLKFHQRLAAARILGQLLAEQLARMDIDLPEVIIPVPLHAKRLRERGYNQSLEIARPVSRRLRLPLDIRLCRRQRHTAPQTGLSARERQRNMRHAFALTRPCDYSHVAILDDVITTGHTVRALSRLLKQNGVERVQVWSVARAVTD